MNASSLLLIFAICAMLVSCRTSDPVPAAQRIAQTFACQGCDTLGVTGLSIERAPSAPPYEDVYVVYQLPGQLREYVYGEFVKVQPQDNPDTVGLFRMSDSLVTASLDKPRCSLYRGSTIEGLVRNDAVLGTLHLREVHRYPEMTSAPTTLAVAMRNVEAIVPAQTLPVSTKPNEAMTGLLVLLSFVFLTLVVTAADTVTRIKI